MIEVKNKLAIESATDKKYSEDFMEIVRSPECDSNSSNLGSLGWNGNIVSEHVRYIQRQLEKHWGIEFIKTVSFNIPNVDPKVVASIVGEKKREQAMEQLSQIRHYVLIGQNPYGQAFDPFSSGKREKITWTQKRYDEFGTENFRAFYQENQFRTCKMTSVSGAAQLLSKFYCKDHPEIVKKLEQVHDGIMERIKGVIDPVTHQEIRRPYWKLDKEEKLQVVNFVEKTCIEILRFFSSRDLVEVFSAQDQAR